MKFLLVLMLLFGVLNVESFGQRPYTHDLIAHDILRLGGDLEGPSEVVFVAYFGKQFQRMHFEMLTHLKSLRWFSSRETNGNSESLGFLRELEKLERIDVHQSGQVVEGFCLLRGKQSVKEVWLHNLKISKSALESIASLPNLEQLNIEEVEILEDAGEILINISSRCDVTVLSATGITRDLQSKLDETIETRRRSKKSLEKS